MSEHGVLSKTDRATLVTASQQHVRGRYPPRADADNNSLTRFQS